MQEELDRINALNLWDFEVARYGCGDLLIIAGNDITQPHVLEAEFRDVEFCDLPQRFCHAQFRLGIGGAIWVTADPVFDTRTDDYEIRAGSVEVRIVRRGAAHNPGH
jgi:hypothetical protein